MIQLTAEQLLERNSRFYKQLANGSSKSKIEKTIARLLFEGCGWEIPNPTSALPQSLRLPSDIAELFTTQVYDKIKSSLRVDFLQEIEQGRVLKAAITLNNESALYDAYKCFSQLVLYARENDKEQKQAEDQAADARANIERYQNTIHSLEQKCREIGADIKRRKGLRKPKLEGPKQELRDKEEGLTQTRSNKRREERRIVQLRRELDSLKQQRVKVQPYLMQKAAEGFERAGLTDLKTGLEAVLQNQGSYMPSSINGLLEQQFNDQIRFKVGYNIEPRQFKKSRWKFHATGIAAVLLSMVAVGFTVRAVYNRNRTIPCAPSPDKLVFAFDSSKGIKLKFHYKSLSSDSWVPISFNVLRMDGKEVIVRPKLPENMPSGEYIVRGDNYLVKESKMRRIILRERAGY
jgi:hypothetical protein